MGYVVSGKKKLVFLVSYVYTVWQLNKHSKYTHLGFLFSDVVFFFLKKETIPHLFVKDKL